MGREVRRVPKDWVHPKDFRGRYIPLERSYSEYDAREWDEGLSLWCQGERPECFVAGGYDDRSDIYGYILYAGKRPMPQDYMPAWPPEERTHYQMYENTSEGTPISPVLESPEELARWLADNQASSFANRTASYEQWLAMIPGSPDKGVS